jgi:hypothetical protein
MAKGKKGGGKSAAKPADQPDQRSRAQSRAQDPFGACLSPGGGAECEAVELVPAQPGFTIALRDILTRAECAALIAAADAVGWEPATAADRAPRKNEAFLDRDALVFKSVPLEQELWRRLRPHLPPVETPSGVRVPVGLHADGPRGEAGQCRIYRYTAGHRFGNHVDVSRKGPGAGEETEYTLLVYLSSQGDVPPGSRDPSAKPLVGGDTVFWASARTELLRFSPVAGTALLHAHGRRCLLHEAEEVTRGFKYVVRADVLYAPAPAPPPSLAPACAKSAERSVGAEAAAG